VRNSLSFAALAVITVLSFSAACSSAPSTSTSTALSPSPGTSASAGQPVEEWVAGFCSSFADYMKQGQMPSSVGGSNPQTFKKDMLAFFDAQISATQDLVTKIRMLGAPAVAGGAQVSASLIQGLTTAESKFRSVREEAASLPTSAYASEKEPTRLLEEFGKAGRGTILAVREFHSNPQLRALVETSPECAAIGGSSEGAQLSSAAPPSG
jgi:hypothetical protein